MVISFCLPESYFVNIFFFYHSMHLQILSSFVCCLSHTLTQAVQASSGTTSIHYQSPFTLNAIKIRIILMRNDMYTRDCDIILWVCVWLTSLPASLAIKGSARNRQDVRLIGPIWAGHERNRPIQITDRSIGASLLVDYFDVFISCLDSNSDGTHSLQTIRQWANEGMLHFSKSDELFLFCCLSKCLIKHYQ